LANALLSADNSTDLSRLRQIGITLAPTQSGAPTFPAVLETPPAVLVNLTTMDPHIQNAYSRQVSAELEQQIGARATLAVAYQRLDGHHLIMAINQNVPTCVAAGANNACRPNPAFANNNQYTAAGASTYSALHLSFVQRPSRWGSYRVSYALSSSMNNVGEAFFNGPIDPTDVAKDWGRSDDDQRHRLIVNGTVDVPASTANSWRRGVSGVRVSALVQAYSPAPFNVTSGVNTLAGTAGRPVVDGQFIPRNSGVGDRFLSVNLRVSRTFTRGRASIEAIAEGFNLTNRRNVTAVNGTFGAGPYPISPSSSFGQPTTVGDPRSWQIGVRVGF
jgi:hypothetical protein